MYEELKSKFISQFLLSIAVCILSSPSIYATECRGFNCLKQVPVDSLDNKFQKNTNKRLDVCGEPQWVFRQDRSIKYNDSSISYYSIVVKPIVLESDNGFVFRVSMIFAMQGITKLANTALSNFEKQGCDRLKYNNDAKLETNKDRWTLNAHFTHEERICSKINPFSKSQSSVTIGKHVIGVQAYAKPILKKTNNEIFVGLDARYRARVLPLYGNISGPLWDTKKSLLVELTPEISASISPIESTLSSNDNGDISAILTLSTIPVKRSLACTAKKLFLNEAKSHESFIGFLRD
ncbi:hypothetical protein [Roseibium sp.]|uniref:hypothetical protein n=1 Tax=Roseibium sp. TaxID=1936156 RepID=UPI003BA8BE32